MPVALEVLRVVEERVVVPLAAGTIPGAQQSRFELLGDAGDLLPVAALIAQRHRHQEVRARLVVRRLHDLEDVLQHVQRQRVAVITIIIVAVRLGRTRDAPDDPEVAGARGLHVDVGAGPPVERRRVELPALVPVPGVVANPVEVPERFLDFRPDAIAILLALDLLDHRRERLLRGVQAAVVPIGGAGRRAPLGVGEAEGDPAPLDRGKSLRRDRGVDVVRLLIGARREEPLGLRLALLVFRRAGPRRRLRDSCDGKKKNRECTRQRTHHSNASIEQGPLPGGGEHTAGATPVRNPAFPSSTGPAMQ